MNYTYRYALPSDQPRIEALFGEMLHAVYGETKPVAPGAMSAYFSGGEDRICLAESAGEVVAFLSMEVHREEPHYVYLDDFCVIAAHRGCGIGTEMLREAERFARLLGFRHLVLHVEKTNDAARRLYERMGYEQLNDEGHRCSMIRNL